MIAIVTVQWLLCCKGGAGLNRLSTEDYLGGETILYDTAVVDTRGYSVQLSRPIESYRTKRKP